MKIFEDEKNVKFFGTVYDILETMGNHAGKGMELGKILKYNGTFFQSDLDSLFGVKFGTTKPDKRGGSKNMEGGIII